jgi:hypothetical protein
VLTVAQLGALAPLTPVWGQGARTPQKP